jgi:type VI secretion system protein ImpJ
MQAQRPLFWHQGLFLQPQHFQISDQHAQFMMKPLLGLAMPYAWGVGDLEVSQAALDNRMFEVLSGNLLFRDGSYVELPGNSVIKPRSFESAWVNGDQPFTIHVGLKQFSGSEANVTIVNSLADPIDVNSRFVTTTEFDEIRDLYAAGPSAKVRHLNFLLKIFWEGELAQLDGYETIAVARLERDGDKIVNSSSFIPPCFTVAGSSLLAKTIKDLRDEIAGRTRQLELYKSPREMQKAEFDASYMVYLLALRSLNRYAPLLFHFSESMQVHPWTVYGLLRQIIGELSTFSERFNLLGESLDGTSNLPPYTHDDLGKCMSAARMLIESLLNEITIGPEFVVSLERQDATFSAELPKGFFGQRHRYYLVTRTETDNDELVAVFQMEAKLGSRNEIGVLVRRALPGVELIHLPAAPQGLPRRSFSRYFRIEPLCAPWSGVESDGTIALNWTNAPEDLKVELVALRG